MEIDKNRHITRCCLTSVNRPTLPQCDIEGIVLYGLHSHDVKRWWWWWWLWLERQRHSKPTSYHWTSTNCLRSDVHCPPGGMRTCPHLPLRTLTDYHRPSDNHLYCRHVAPPWGFPGPLADDLPLDTHRNHFRLGKNMKVQIIQHIILSCRIK